MSALVDHLKQLKSACVSKWISDGYAKSYQDTCVSYFSDPVSDTITPKSFIAGCMSIVPQFSKSECQSIFKTIDGNRDGSISYEEFSRKFQPMLSSSRRKFVSNFFDSLDTSKPADRSNPVITVADIQLPKLLTESSNEYISKQNALNLAKLRKHILTVLGNYNLNTVVNTETNEITKKCASANKVKDNATEKFDITDADTITYTEFINYYSDMSLRFDKNQDKDFEAFVTDEWSHARIFA